MDRRPVFYDVTLRDGNQALKKPWSSREKLTIFRLLQQLGISQVEVGYPKASALDFECSNSLAQYASPGMVISGLARANEIDVRSAVRAIADGCEKSGATPRLHTFIGMSPYHMDEVLDKSPEEVKLMAVEAVKLAKSLLPPNGQVQFSPEHFGDCRENLDWVIEALQEIVAAGAKIINLPNTVERYRPTIFTAMVQRVVDALPKDVIVAVHCHNDLGMATATTVESFFAGATQLEVTLNGLGERAGNTNLYEVAVALENNGVATGLNLEQIYETALMVSEMSSIPIPVKAPLLGPEVFIHRSGIHQHGAIKTEDKTKGAYRPIDPRVIGRAGDEICEFTSQSGWNAAFQIIREAGLLIAEHEAKLLQPALKAVSESRGALTNNELVIAYNAYQELKKKKLSLTDAADVLAVVTDAVGITGTVTWELVSATALAGVEIPNATVRLYRRSDDRTFTASSFGDGPVDAAYKAIVSITGTKPELKDYRIKEVTPGSDAQGGVAVVLKLDGNKCEGYGAGTDIVLASIKAYLNALNRLLRGETNGQNKKEAPVKRVPQCEF